MKKFFFRMLLLALVCSVGTATFAQKKALAEDFESGALPSGWTTTNSLWRWTNGEAQFIALVENGVDTLFTPRVDIASLENQPTVTIDYRMVVNQERVNPLTVLYRTAATPEWTVLQQIETPAETATRLYLPLPANVASATDLQLALAAKYLLGGQTAIDYLAIENNHEVPNAPTNLQTEELTSSSAGLRWAVCKSDYFVQYNLKVSTFELTNMTDVADVFDGNVRNAYTTLETLTPNTQYFVYVRYECEDEDYSPWATFDFRTPCSAVTLPLTQDFEQPLNNCYTILKTSKTAAQSATFPYNSQKAFSFVSSKNTYNYLFFPEAQQSLTDYQVSFMVASELAGTTYGRELTIGVATDATAENFTEVKTITLPQGRRWEKVTISLAGYKGTGKILAFKAGNADKENHIVIDDVSIEPASACPMPMFVNVSEVTSNSAKLAWVEAGNATEWNLVLAMREYADPFDCEPNESKGEYAGSITTNPYVATNLLPNTTYYAYLQSACGESEWTQVYSFTTQEEVSIPYQQAFDRLDPALYSDDANAVPPMWLMGSRLLYADNTVTNHDKENSDSYLPYISTADDHTASAYVSAALLLRGTSFSSYSGSWNTSYAMMPAMPCALNQLLLSFYAKSNDAALKLVVGVANTQTTDLENGKQLSGTGNVTPVDTLSFAASGEWEQKSLSLVDYAGTGKYITFWVVSATSTPAVYIDDIIIDYAPTCFPVQNLTATATSTTAAKVTWTETLKATAWDVKVSTSEINPATQNGDVVSSKRVTAQEYAFSGLTANTKYYVYVSPACGDQWAATTVTTLYALTVPYYNDFSTEPTGTGKMPNYWIVGNAGGSTSTTYKPYVYNTAWSANTGYTIPAEVTKPSLYFYGGTTSSGTSANNKPFAVMPELSNAQVKDVTLSFWGHSNNTTAANGRILRIGVLTDPNDISTLTEVTTVRLQSYKVSEFFMVNMSAYTGNGKYIVFYSDTTGKANYFMMDNLSITLSASPQRVTDVKATATTTTSATIEWKENGDATNWEVLLFEGATANPDEDTPLKTATASTDAMRQLSGLTHSTQYTVYVRAVKGTEKGAWSMPLTFWTETDKWTLPFYENFDTYATGGTTNNTLPPYYEMGASTASTYPYVYKASYAVAKDPDGLYQMAYRFYASSSTKNIAQLVLPVLEQPINTLQMSMMANTYYSSTSYVHRLEVGVLPTGATDVVAVTTLELSQTSAWEEWLLDFSSYTGGDGQIVLTCTYDATAKKSNDVMIDNLSISAIPQCKKVQTISARAITQTGATVAWEAAGDEAAWNLKVSSTELDDPATATADMFDGAVSTAKQTLSNLSADTEYFVYVQSTNASKDCVGEWSQVFSFHTLCDAVVRPYSENFDAMDKGIVPPCYTLSGKITDATAAATGQNTGATSQALKLSQVDKAHTNYCAFPLVACEDIKDLQLAMQVLPGSWGTAGLTSDKWSWYFYEIGIMTDPNDPTTYVAVKVDSVAADGSKQPVDKRYTFDTYAGDESGAKGKYIAIKVLPYKSSTGKEYSGVIYVDNVTIGDKETCIMPTQVAVVEYSNDTVRLSWKAEEKTGTFRVRIFDHADADFDTDTPVKDTVVTDTTQAVISGLDGNTLYYATVRRECGAEDGNSRWSTVTSWRSECEEVQTLPYVETFEGYTANAPANCWGEIQTSYVQQGSNQTVKLYAYVSTAAAKDGTLGLYLQYNSSASAKPKAITPKLDVTTLKDVVLYFDARSYSSSAATSLLIEAVESQAVDAASVTITTVDIPTAWQTIYLKLADVYTSAQPYQYLRFSVAGKQAVYMDNLHITTNPNEVVPVNALSVKNVRDTSAIISFAESTPGISSWQVEYGVKGFELGTGMVLTLDTTACTLTGLTSLTSYDVYVKSNVSGSAYVGPLSFTTVKPAAQLPYYYGFEDADENANLWTLTNVNAVGNPCPNTFTFGDAANVGGTGNTSLYVQYNGQYGYCPMQADGNLGLSYVWATRNVDIPSKGTYVVGVKARCPGNKKVDNEKTDYMVVALAPAVCTPLASNIMRPDGTNGSAGTTKTAYNEFNIVPSETICGVSDYTEFSGKALITEPGMYQIMLYWYNPSVSEAPGTIYEPVAVDSVWVEEYDCTAPSNHHLTALSDTEAAVAWEAGANKNFEVILSRYRKAAHPELLDEQDMVAHSFVSGEPVFRAANLLPNTTYALYQRPLCVGENTEWVEFDFTTECIDEQLPYTETFSETPGCWTLSSGVAASTILYRTDEMEANGEDAEPWSYLKLPVNGLAVLPDFGVPVQQLGITMATFNSFYTPIYTIGVMTDPWDAETFEPVMTVPTGHALSSTSSVGSPYVLETVQKLFNLYKGNGRYIAIKGDVTNITNIKYITVEQLPSCIAPMQVEITDIQETSVVVNWLTGSETQWQIACDGDTLTVRNQPYTLTGLQQGQTYSLAVRALCEENEESAWSQEVQFTTNCGVNAMPLTIHCDALADKAGSNVNFTLPNCWQQLRSTISLDSLNRQRKPATEVLERLPKETTRNYYTYYKYKFGVPYQSNLDKYFGGKAHLMSNCFQEDLTSSKGTYYKWLVLPAIEANEGTQLSFHLAWANILGCTFYNPNNGNYNQVEPVDFRIVVSEDGGETYQALQKIDLAQYDSTFRQVEIDLSAYAGKAVQVGFYHAMCYSTGSYLPDIRLADVRINCTMNYPISDVACEGYDYERNGFVISKDSLPEPMQQKQYTRFAANQQTSGCDSIVTLTLTTEKSAIETVHATICEGSSYSFGPYELTEPNQEGQPYMLLGTTANGCDSTIYLYLSVTPAVRASAGTKYINTGATYDFNGKVLSQTGVYYDTLRAENGCDSIVELHLYVVNKSIGYEEITVCANEMPFHWKTQVLTEAGNYSFDTLTVVGTDSVVALTLNVLPTFTTSLGTKYINMGESFAFNNQLLTQTGMYYDTLAAVNGCDSVLSLRLVAMAKQKGNIQMSVCQNELPVLWKDQTIEKAGVYTFDTLTIVGTDSVVTLTLNVLPVVTFELNTLYANEGTAIDWFGQTLSQSGTYFDTLTAANGCDSIVSQQVIFLPKKESIETRVVCANELPFLWKGQDVTQAGLYHYNTKTTVGTDSVVTLIVEELPTYLVSLGTAFINNGETYDFFGQTIKETGSYYDTLQTIHGCDSVVSINVVVKGESVGYEDMTVCPAELPTTWKGIAITDAGVYQFDTLTTVGTDSVVCLTVTVLPSYKVSLGTVYINAGGSYDFFGEVITATGVYTHTLSTIHGCDSVLSINVIEAGKQVGYETMSVCEAEYPVLWKGQTCPTAGTYSFDTLTTLGMDSIVYLTLTTLPASATDLGAVYINEGDTYDFFGQIVSQTGTYYNTLQNIYGCDSVVSIRLFAEAKHISYQNMSMCQNELPIEWKGKTLTQAGTYTFDTLSVLGTDSVVTLTLTVLPTYDYHLGTKYINEGEIYNLSGLLITESGTYQQTLSTVNGCDSVLTITIIAEPKHEANLTMTICQNELPILWKGQTLTQSGTYQCDTLTKLGTDSVIYLTLNILPTYAIDTTIYVNEGDPYEFGDSKLTESGLYTDTLLTVNGCDSVMNLTLVVVSKQVGTESLTVCANELPVLWKDQTIRAAGVYSFDTLTTVGTDSVVTLTLTVNDTYRTADTLKICEGDSLLWEGIMLSEAGEYQVTYTSVAHCDSVMMLSLEVVRRNVIQVDTVITTADLPFVFLEDTLLDVGTQEGIYDTAIVVNGEPCSTIYNLHITVKMGEGINNVGADKLNIYPTMIAVGEKVNLSLPQADELTVTVMDMTGDVMATYHPANTHLVMDDFYTAGMYIVRVTSSNGYCGLGKVIVK